MQIPQRLSLACKYFPSFTGQAGICLSDIHIPLMMDCLQWVFAFMNGFRMISIDSLGAQSFVNAEGADFHAQLERCDPCPAPTIPTYPYPMK